VILYTVSSTLFTAQYILDSTGCSLPTCLYAVRFTIVLYSPSKVFSLGSYVTTYLSATI